MLQRIAILFGPGICLMAGVISISYAVLLSKRGENGLALFFAASGVLNLLAVGFVWIAFL